MASARAAGPAGPRLLAALAGLAACAGPAAASPFGEADYWDAVYTAGPRLASGPLAQPWQGVGYEQLVAALGPGLGLGGEKEPRKERRVLVLGAGDSPLPESLAYAGMGPVTAVDFSEAVVTAMAARSKGRQGLEWQLGDVRNLSLANRSFDVAIDVGVLDTLATSEGRDAEDMLAQVHRVLRNRGIYISVSSEPPLLREKLFHREPFPRSWITSVFTLPRPRQIDPRVAALDPEFDVGVLHVYLNAASDDSEGRLLEQLAGKREVEAGPLEDSEEETPQPVEEADKEPASRPAMSSPEEEARRAELAKLAQENKRASEMLRAAEAA